MLVRLHVDRQRVASLAPVGDVGGRDAAPVPSVSMIPHGADQQMRFLADQLLAAGHGVKPGRQAAQQPSQLWRGQPVRVGFQQVHDVPAR